MMWTSLLILLFLRCYIRCYQEKTYPQCCVHNFTCHKVQLPAPSSYHIRINMYKIIKHPKHILFYFSNNVTSSLATSVNIDSFGMENVFSLYCYCKLEFEFTLCLLVLWFIFSTLRTSFGLGNRKEYTYIYGTAYKALCWKKYYFWFENHEKCIPFCRHQNSSTILLTMILVYLVWV